MRTLHSGSVTVGIHSLMVTDFVLAAMNQMARAAMSTEPIVRSLMSCPLTVKVEGVCAFVAFRAMGTIIGRLVRAGDSTPRVRRPDSAPNTLAHDARRGLGARYREGMRVGVSDRTLSRLFRRDLGMTFPQWRTQLRLHHALVLLTGRTPVTAVAHQCGWSSTSAFIDVFRRTFGHTPGPHPTG